MTGQVLDISKHENTVRTPHPQGPGRSARLYRFPAGKCVMPVPPPPPVHSRKFKIRLHLMIELTIGLMLWLIWFIWRLTH